MDAWWYPATDGRSDLLAIQLQKNVVRLICVLEQIDQHLAQCDSDDRLRWQGRRNSAVYLLNRTCVTASQKGLLINFECLPPAQQLALAEGHSLLDSLHYAMPPTSPEIISELREDVQRRVRKLCAKSPV